MHGAAISKIVHSFLAILAGFGTVVLLITSLTLLIEKYSPALSPRSGEKTSAFYYTALWYSVISAVCGGFVTAWIGGQDSLGNVLALALAVLLMNALAALQLRGQQPVAYQFALIVFLPIGVVLGGLVRLHQAGYRW